MTGNALINLISTFSKKEMKEFGDFLRSPYFNKRKGAVKLFDILRRDYPQFKAEKISREIVFDKLFPGKKYKDTTLRVLVHYLMELAEKFLAYSRYEKNQFEFSQQLHFELLDRKQYKLLEKNLKRSENLLQNSGLDSEDYFFYKYRLENAKTFYKFAAHYGYADKIIESSDWEGVFRDFTNFYILKSMSMYLNTLNTGKLYNKNFNSEAFKNIFNKINIKDFSDYPVITMYYHMIKMITDPTNEKHFYIIKELLRKHKPDFNTYDVIGAYVNLEGYCLDRITEENEKFEKELFNIFKEELEDKSTYQTSDGFMSPLFYRKVVTAGLQRKEFSFVNDFMHKYKNELDKKFRDNYFFYCSALYEFNMKNYESALELISVIKFDELYIKLNSKILQIMVFFEMGIEDSLESAIQSFRQFVNNTKLIPEKRRVSYRYFCKYLNKIVILKTRKDDAEKMLIIHELQKEKDVINKKWLLEKIALMK